MWLRLIPTEKTDPELAPFRAGLVFGFFNAMTWQIGIGTPMVLFAEVLGATPLQVGLAYSFVFVLTPLQVLSTPLLSHFGYKRVMLSGWGIRSLFLAAPLVLTYFAARLGPQAWMVQALVWSVFFFCFFRSIGAAASVPWLYSILPEGARGRYFGSDQFISAVAGVGTLIVCAGLFAMVPIYGALAVMYGIAVAGSAASFFALKRLPDGSRPEPVSLRVVARDTPRHMFVRSDFRRFLGLAVIYAVATTSIPPFVAYYLRVVPQLSAGQIMSLEVARYAGVIAAAALLRRKIDRTGAKPFFVLAMVLQAVVAVFWWVYLQGGGGALGGVYAAYFMLGAGAACWAVGTLNYLAKVTPGASRALMLAVHGAVTACCGGLAPILWGGLLRGNTAGGGAALNVGMFQVFFLVVLASAVVLSSRLAKMPEDKAAPADPLVIGNAVLRPFRALTYLVNLIDLRQVTVPVLKKSAQEKTDGKKLR